MVYYEQLEDRDVEYIDVTNCPHEKVTWTEQPIAESNNAYMVGYKCDYCGEWVEKGEDDGSDDEQE